VAGLFVDKLKEVLLPKFAAGLQDFYQQFGPLPIFCAKCGDKLRLLIFLDNFADVVVCPFSI
jgi:hypothetical protein